MGIIKMFNLAQVRSQTIATTVPVDALTYYELFKSHITQDSLSVRQ